MTDFGLTTLGFVPMQQQDVVTDLETALQQEFGGNINLGAESVFGQLVGILSERFALLWLLGEAIYASQYPSGAEGTSVDNILALNNLKRLGASASTTDPDSVIANAGVILEGLVVYGTPGTVIPAGDLIQNSASPPVQFSLINAVTIGAPAKAVQSLFFSSVPDSGTFDINVTEGPKLAGNVFGGTFGSVISATGIPYNAIANKAQISFSATPSTGSFKIQVTQAGVVSTTALIAYTANAAAVQSAIAALTGYSGVTVSGSFAAGFQITWGAICHPICATTTNTLAVSISVIDSVQAKINNLHDVPNAYYPWTDVTVAGFTVGMVFTFGGLAAAVGSNPQSLNQPQPLMTVTNNTMLTGSTVVNLNVASTVLGNGIGDSSTGVTPALGICIVTGPNFIAAGTLTSIATPVSGWAGVYNQLDCLTGTNLEDDTEALQRRSLLLAAQANGPLQAIVQKVLKVKNVTAALGFQNLTNAAQQLLNFASVPVAGNFKLNLEALTTANIAYNATSADIQSAIRLLTGFSTVLVAGNMQNGFVIDFNGSRGNQGIGLFSVVSNTTGVIATMIYGRPAHDFEVVVQGGADAEIAQAIYGSSPAGIGSYGSTTVQIFDAFDNPVNISFSRPTQVEIWVTINLTTDTYNTPGDSGSGSNPLAKFNPQSVSDIQSDIITIGNAVQIGGLIIGFGSSGLIGAFNSVPGIVSYTLAFGTAPNPTLNDNIQMQAEQVPLFETFNVIVSYQ